MRNMTKQMRDGQVMADATLGSLCWDVIRHAKKGDGKWAAGKLGIEAPAY